MKHFFIIFITMLFNINCTFLVNKLAFYPDSINYLPGERLPQKVQEHFIETSDGKKLQVYYIKNQLSNKMLIYFHGNAGNISGRLDDFLAIHGMGISVLGVGYRGYGKSSGRPSEKGIYRDGEAAFTYATKTLGYSSSNIFLFGRSIGSTVAVNLSQNKNLAGVVLATPLSTGKEYAKFHGLGLLSHVAGDAFNNIKKAPHISSPTLIIHGDNDRTVPHKMGKRFFNALPKGEKKFVTIPYAGHNDISTSFANQYWQAVQSFIRAYPKP